MATVLRRFWKNTRTTRWVVIAGVALIASIALVMMFLLAQATNNREIYERNYQRLFVANMVAAAVLLVVLCWLSWRMWLRLRRGKFGSRLLLKLALVFTLVASVALFGSLPIRFAIYRKLVRRQGGEGAERRVESGTECARHPDCGRCQQDTGRGAGAGRPADF